MALMLALLKLLLSATATVAAPTYRQLGSGVSLPAGPWLHDAQDVQWKGNRLCARLRRDDGTHAASCVAVQPGQELENVDGSFQTHISQMLPYGTWIDSAKDYRLEGSILYATLRHTNGTWAVPTFTWVDKGQTFANDDGRLVLMSQACAAGAPCPLGFTMHSGASRLFCSGVVCDYTRDLDKCCYAVPPCAEVSEWCPEGRVADPFGFCADSNCTEADIFTCCIRSQPCTSLSTSCRYPTSLSCVEAACLDGYVLRSNATDILCGFQCDATEHRELCCEPSPPCSNASHLECPLGYYLNSAAYCMGAMCDDNRDRGVCCQEAMHCSEGYTCPFGYAPRTNETGTFCAAAICVLERDRDSCCYAAGWCSNLTCPHGFTTLPQTYCYGEVCDPEVDVEHCCQGRALCTDLGTHTCERGYHFNSTEFCVGVACDMDHDLTPETSCCQPSDNCSSLECPVSFTPMENGTQPIYCASATCSLVADRDTCCEAAAACNESVCSWGFVLTANAMQLPLYCLGATCKVERDQDVCCEPAALCEASFTCPHGYTPVNNTQYCGGPTCDSDRDLLTCCEAAEPCESLACGFNRVTRFGEFCDGPTCILERDLARCCKRGMEVQYIKFVPTEVRDTGSTVVQIAEFVIFYQGEAVTWQNVTAYSLNGDYELNEEPPKVIDGSTDTKWLDKSLGDFIVMLHAPYPLENYSFISANDLPERDPWRWTLQGSLDGTNFVVMHQVSSGEPFPEERFAETEIFTILLPCLAPEQITNAANVSCAEGELLASGSSCTSRCASGYTATVASLNCTEGKLSPEAFSCV